jgi:hypothetical protein
VVCARCASGGRGALRGWADGADPRGRAAAVRVQGGGRQPAAQGLLERPPTELAADGRAIPGGAYQQPPPREPTRYWSYPHRPPPGACSISARSGSGVRVTQGAVVAAIVPDAGIIGHAFLSCEDVEISLGGTSLAAAVLLDAQRVGQVWLDMEGGGPDRQLAVLGHIRVTVAHARRPVLRNSEPNLLLRVGPLLY